MEPKSSESARAEVDKNYDAFVRILPTIIGRHRNKFALMRGGEIVGYYSSLEDAYMTGEKFFLGQPFSVQKVTDTPVDLGFFSHAVDIR